MRTLYPARVQGTTLVHLARTEARADDAHALFAVCPAGPGITIELELVPAEDEARIVWCPDCAAYRDYLTPREELTVDERAGRLEETGRIRDAIRRGDLHPSPPAPEWMLGE